MYNQAVFFLCRYRRAMLVHQGESAVIMIVTVYRHLPIRSSQLLRRSVF